MKLEAEDWVMSDATTVKERLAFLHWSQFMHLLAGQGVDVSAAIQRALDELPAREKMALANLSERAPADLGIPQFHLNFK